jgi:HD-GYP domain-containing protein (c-di-GMP phosphodiesterase class II)
MWRNVTANLSDLLFSVAEAMDMSDVSLADHQLRTAFVAGQMAEAARFEYMQMERIFVAALLHDIGALSPEEKVSAHIYEDLLPEPHCQRGAKLYREAFWLAPSAQMVEWHHTPMLEHELQGRSLAQPDVLGAQIIFLADHLERFIRRDVYILHQVDALERKVRALAGKQVHEEVVALFDQVCHGEDFWLELVAKNLSQEMREHSLLRAITVDFETARSIAGVFKDMTDFRSRFTATHSAGVAASARAIGQALSFTGKDLQQIYLAGLMHDMGKLVVPNAILCKPGNLTVAEYEVVRQHSYYTLRTLARVRGFEQIAEWAGFHHERLNGTGYGRHLSSSELDLGAKVVAVADVATAIAENRPYRLGGDKDKVLSELGRMAEKGQLEPMIVHVLGDHYDSIMSTAAHAQAEDEARYRERYALIQSEHLDAPHHVAAGMNFRGLANPRFPRSASEPADSVYKPAPPTFCS